MYKYKMCTIVQPLNDNVLLLHLVLFLYFLAM